MAKINIGGVYNNVTVLEIKKYSLYKDSKNRVKYQCSCGRISEKREDVFLKYKTKCECEKTNEHDKIVGQTVFNITVIQKIYDDKFNPKYRCICNTCKEYKIITYETLKNKKGKFRGCVCPSLNIKSSQNYVYTAYKIAAKKRGYAFDISFEYFIELCEKPCFYCGKEKSNVRKVDDKFKAEWFYNGIDRKNNNLGYINNNVVSCCKLCNKIKSALDYNEFIDHIYNIRDNMENKKCQNTT